MEITKPKLKQTEELFAYFMQELKKILPMLAEDSVWTVKLLKFDGVDGETGEDLIGIPPRLIVRLIHFSTQVESQVMIFPQMFEGRSMKFKRDNVLEVGRLLTRLRGGMKKLINPETAATIHEQAQGIFRKIVFSPR